MDAKQPADPVPAQSERALIDALRAGDEAAYTALLDAHGASMLRVARTYVRDHAKAEDVVQDAWLALFRGLDDFEGRSSLKTWLFSILVNIARTRARKEQRSMPFAVAFGDADDGERAVPADRFFPAGNPWTGHWLSGPQPWTLPEDAAISAETMAVVREAIATLPETQREVISLRDIDGWASVDVCNVLGLSETNQRVLLHRARSRVRRSLEEHFGERGAAR